MLTKFSRGRQKDHGLLRDATRGLQQDARSDDTRATTRHIPRGPDTHLTQSPQHGHDTVEVGHSQMTLTHAAEVVRTAIHEGKYYVVPDAQKALENIHLGEFESVEQVDQIARRLNELFHPQSKVRPDSLASQQYREWIDKTRIALYNARDKLLQQNPHYFSFESQFRRICPGDTPLPPMITQLSHDPECSAPFTYDGANSTNECKRYARLLHNRAKPAGSQEITQILHSAQVEEQMLLEERTRLRQNEKLAKMLSSWKDLQSTSDKDPKWPTLNKEYENAFPAVPIEIRNRWFSNETGIAQLHIRTRDQIAQATPSYPSKVILSDSHTNGHAHINGHHKIVVAGDPARVSYTIEANAGKPFLLAPELIRYNSEQELKEENDGQYGKREIAGLRMQLDYCSSVADMRDKYFRS